jgi:heme exporter protein B
VAVLDCALPREAWRLRDRVGYLGHGALLYRELTGRENLRYQARLFGLGGAGEERVELLLERVGLLRRADDRVREFSAGMVQRLAVCRAVLHDPELLLLDEPLSHLDPEATAALAPLIGSASGRSRVVVTHDVRAGLAEADRILALARDGTLVIEAPVGAVSEAELRAVYAGTASPDPVAAGAAAGPGAVRRRPGPRLPGDHGREAGAPSPGRDPTDPDDDVRPVTRRASTAGVAGTILAKDLRVELRALQSVPAMALFAITTFVLFRFALDRTTLEGNLAAGVLLATILFAAILGINRLFVAEREEGGFEAIRLAPVDGTALFLAKAAALLVYLVILEAIALPIFAIFFLDAASGLVPLAAVLLLVDVGLAVTGTLISSMATNSRARDLLAPLILLPLFVPLMIAAAGAAGPLLELDGPSYDRFGTWLSVLALYDLIFLLVGYAVFDFLLED